MSTCIVAHFVCVFFFAYFSLLAVRYHCNTALTNEISTKVR